jgi:hypothetical protein
MSDQNDDNNSSRKSITPAHQKSIADDILRIWRKPDHRKKDNIDEPMDKSPKTPSP